MFDRAGRMIGERTRLIDDLLALMTLEEKLGQLLIAPGLQQAHDKLAAGLVGHIWLDRSEIGTDLGAIRELQRITVEESRLGIPLTFAADTSNGVLTQMPSSRCAAASWNPEAIARSDRIAAIEAAACGICWAFGPSVGAESDIEEPMLASRIIAARIRGLQGDNLNRPDAVLANLSFGPRADSAETFLPPFLASAREGRVGCIDLHDAPLDPLSRRWDTGAIVLSEWRAIAAAALGEDAPSLLAFPLDAAIDAVRSGRVSAMKLDNAVRRVIGAKFDLGLLRDPYLYCGRGASKKPELSPVHREVALDIVSRAVVLLKNENAVLPLASGARDLAIIGGLAADTFERTGFAAMAEGVSLVDAFQRGGMKHRFLPHLSSRDQAPDVAICMIGAGTPEERKQIRALAASHSSVIAVVCAPELPTLDWLEPSASAILYCGDAGPVMGEVLAELILGESSPRGKLPEEPPCRTYPFGHGLGYGDFAYDDLAIERQKDQLAAVCRLKNIGKREAEETVQLYIEPVGAPKSTRRALKAFAKVRLAAGETRDLSFDLGAGELGMFAENGLVQVAPGDYRVAIGGSSATRNEAVAHVSQELADTMTSLAGGGRPAIPDRDIRLWA
ncbi:glycoside hydrolase family 3 C-terminal domain-containing protein [Qipengyuania atrilutea]|uniref:Glycoside hydrolase family 3 C-terminal domain-containing protein n=1 Tax=Qipengyuania atrilutea TaxID=2744473 RepID=A0A850H4I9_9SPHN|nr:glycoside hydrolase family 3 C-terminal domain-containing protein [Actirhodobacter atriluteus]NVD45530.1 glycoside hydrolase family 3 C-terminal domain-containing protein [Actirhodobacter atriluteus]